MLERKSNAPCKYYIWDDAKQRDVMVYPNVDCEQRCVKCGWNPEVHDRRIEALKKEREKKPETENFLNRIQSVACGLCVHTLSSASVEQLQEKCSVCPMKALLKGAEARVGTG